MIRHFLLIVLCLSAPVVKAQQLLLTQIRINEVFENIPLSKVLKTLQSNYKIKVAYEPTLVQNIWVVMELKDMSVTETFEKLLHNTPLTFNTVSNNIIIVPAPAITNQISVKRSNIRLSGNVLDADNGETLPFAAIKVKGTNIATTANVDGHFTLLNIPNDTCKLEISYMGYITQNIPVRDTEENIQLVVNMKSDTKILNEVVILDDNNQAAKIEEQPGAVVFNPRSLNNLPSLGEQDIFRTMQLIPGVTATDETSSGMVIRGMHPSYNLTLLDGMTIYQQDHFFGSFSIINSDVIKDVRVHKGMFDAKYGGRVSGVVDITTKNGNAVKPAFNVRLNGINAKFTAEIPLGKKWSLFTGARRSYTDIAQTKLFNKLFDVASTSNDQLLIFYLVGEKIAPSYYFFDTNSKLTFRPSSKDLISVSFYLSRDKFQSTQSSTYGVGAEKFKFENNQLIRWGNDGASLRWSRQWNDRYYSNIRISHSDFFRRSNKRQYLGIEDMSSTYFINMKSSIRDLSYAIDNEWLYHNLSLEFGGSGIRQLMSYNINDKLIYETDFPPDELPEDWNINQREYSWLHSIYGSVSYSPVNKLTTTAGARLSHYYNETGQMYFEPRLSAKYKITEDLNVKAGYARSNQFITQAFYPTKLTGSISGLNENFWLISRPGDSGFPVITSDHISTGATLNKKNFTYDAEVYYKVSQGVIIDEDFNYADTDIYGIDVMLQKTSGIHKGWIAYSLARATQTHPYILNGESAPMLQDQRHEVKVVDMITLGKWNFSSTLIYGSGKPYPKYTIRYYRDDNNQIQNHEAVLDYRNKSRLPTYFRVDVSIAYKKRFKDVIEIETGLSLYNITDHKNLKTRVLDESVFEEAVIKNEELAARYNDIVLLGFSPTLFINFSF